MKHEVSSPNPPPSLWSGQFLHFAGLAVLLAALALTWTMLGRPFPIAFWVAVAVPVLHQVFVWLAWRLELLSSATSENIGFRGYLVAFFVLFVSRIITLTALAWLDQGSLTLAPNLQTIFAIFLAIPGFYAIYSVQRYFGLARAAGADHFDKRYRDMPLVDKGIFRFTKNGMYLYAFLLFWAIAIGFGSVAALFVAAFSHAYIWVHFYATEKPDMDFLYAPRTMDHPSSQAKD